MCVELSQRLYEFAIINHGLKFIQRVIPATDCNVIFLAAGMRFPAEELDDEGDLLPIVPAQGDHEECRDSFETSIHDSITPAPPPIYNRHTLRLGVAFLMLGFLTTSIGMFISNIISETWA